MSYAEALPSCPRPYGDDVYNRLKAQFRALVRKCGGLECVADRLSVSVATVHNWQKPDDHRFPPLTALLVLEADAGDAMVSRELVRVLQPPHPEALDPERMAIEFSAQSGRFSQTVLDAIRDGHVSRIELLGMAEVIRPAMDTVQKISDEIYRQLEARKAG